MVSEKKTAARHRLLGITFIGYFILILSVLMAVWGVHNEGTYADWVELIGIGQCIVTVFGIVIMWIWYIEKDWSKS